MKNFIPDAERSMNSIGVYVAVFFPIESICATFTATSALMSHSPLMETPHGIVPTRKTRGDFRGFSTSSRLAHA